MLSPVVQIVLVVVGLGLVGLGLWERGGRGRNARAWLRSSDRGVRGTLFTRPGLGLAALCLGLFPWVEQVGILATVDVLLLVAGVLAGFAWGVFAFPFPLWAAPPWSRDRLRTDRADAHRTPQT